jgi:hypothetical protein
MRMENFQTNNGHDASHSAGRDADDRSWSLQDARIEARLRE